MTRNGLLYRLVCSPAFLAGFAIVAAAVLLAVSSHVWLTDDPMAMVGAPFVFPGDDPHFPLGTDMLGRNVLTQLAHGSEISLLIGVISATIAVSIGLSIGLISGYFGGLVDKLFTIVTELFQTLPPLLLAIVLVAVLTPSLWSVVLAVGITSWTTIARVVRPEVMRLRHADFVQAARLCDMSNGQILVIEILPNVLSSVIVLASMLIGSAILTEAALSFLGLSDPNVISWGSMIGTGRAVLRDGWYISAFPGLATLLTVLGFTLLANGLNDALNRRITL